MNARPPIPTLAAAAAVLLGGLLAGCGSSEARDPASAGGSASAASSTTAGEDTDAPAESASAAACGAKTTARPQLGAQLPAGFATVAGWTPSELVSQGKTRAVRGFLRGDADDIAAVRDAAVARIVAAGYLKTGSDQEPGFEADADFTGPHQGNINVRSLCQGFLLLTYTIQS
jgi:hypothetical protein